MRKFGFVAIVLLAAACQKSDSKSSGSASASGTASASASASGTGGASASAMASGDGSASASASGTASGTAAASGSADDGATPTCADIIDLEMKIMSSAPGVTDTDKQQMAQQRDGAVQQCNGSPPPPELAKCLIKQTAIAGFQKCANDYQEAHKPPPPPLPDGLRRPTKDDLATFTKDLKGSGPITATIETDKGTIHCELLGDKAPVTVANFVGLATGQLPWMDPKTHKVQTGKPFFDGLVFHRVVPGFMIQGGDPNGDGSGGPGYEFDNEDSDLVFDKPGVMAMANAGRDTNGSQFFIMDAPHPDLNGGYTVFGQCKDPDVVHAIVSVPAGKNKPEYADTPVVIKKVTISK